MIKFTAEISPVPFNRPRFGKAKQIFDSPRYSAFKNELGYQARAAMVNEKMLTGALTLRADFYKKSQKLTSKNWGDLDNYLKAVLDALNGICFVDDSQVVKIAGTKNYSDNPRIIIQIEEVTA